MKHSSLVRLFGLLLGFMVLVAACDDVLFELAEDIEQAESPAGGSDDDLLAPDSFDFGDGNEEGVVGDPAGWYDIYFTDPQPTCPAEEDRTGGLDELIAEDILQAQFQVDLAGFDIDAEPIVNALIELEDRGLIVRVVTDTDNEDLSAIRRLRRNGISVPTDDRSGLMHNKFIIIDSRYVWMGSMNFTTNGVYCNNNNFVRIDSPELATNYTAEMNEMYDDRSFGPRSPDATPAEQLVIGGVTVENYFAPEKRLIPLIAERVQNAQQEILFMAFSFTHDDLGEAMLDRAEAGVVVQGVFETTGSNTDFSYYPIMSEEGLLVRQDGNGRIMHHKVIIIDRSITILGSFNFSNNANDRNDENILIVHDPTFASFFVEEFMAVWAEGKLE